MTFRITPIILSLAFAMIFIGNFACQNDKKAVKTKARYEQLSVPTDSFLIKQVETNLRGLNMEDLNIALEPLDLTSPYMSEAERAVRGAFMVYEMEFKLQKVEIQFKSDTLCKALVVHDSRNHNERSFDSQRSHQRYYWRPVDGQWKITMMEILGSTPVDY